KAATNATAYTVASIAMPSLPEIAAVNAAVVASANPPGAVSGALEAAEVAKTAMDVRAALVMETYEAATTAVVTTPGEFRLPPRIAEGAGTADAASAAQSSFQDDPLQTAVAGAVSALNHAGALNHAANVATTVASSGASTVGNLGPGAIAAGALVLVASGATTAASGGASTVGTLGAGAIAAAASGAPALAAAPAGLAGAGLAAGVGGPGLAATHAATVGIGSTALPNGSVQ